MFSQGAGSNATSTSTPSEASSPQLPSPCYRSCWADSHFQKWEACGLSCSVAFNIAANVGRRRLPVLKGGFCVSTVSGRGRWLSSRVASTASGDGSAEDDHRRLVWLTPDLPSPVSCEHISSTGCHRSEPGDGTLMIERICKPNLAKNYFVASGRMRIRAG
jgi:hypothetical protein